MDGWHDEITQIVQLTFWPTKTGILVFQSFCNFQDTLHWMLMQACTQPVRGVTEMVVMIITRVGWDDWLLYNFQDRLYESRADPSVKSYSGRDSAGHLYWRCNTVRYTTSKSRFGTGCPKKCSEDWWKYLVCCFSIFISFSLSCILVLYQGV